MKGTLHHIELYVKDLNKSKEFWGWLLDEDKHPYAGGEGYYAVYFEDPDRMKVEITA